MMKSVSSTNLTELFTEYLHVLTIMATDHDTQLDKQNQSVLLFLHSEIQKGPCALMQGETFHPSNRKWEGSDTSEQE